MGFWTRRITNVAALMGGTAASTLLGGETDGLAIDFTDASLTVRDTTTTSNTWGQIEGNAQDFWRSRSFTSYSSPSPKITRDSSGNYTYRPHNILPTGDNLLTPAWTALRVTKVASGESFPTGYAVGVLVTEDTSVTTDHLVYTTSTLAVTASIPYTVSAVVKAGTCNFVGITWSGGVAENFISAVFDLSAANASASETDVGTSSGTVLSTSQTDLGNGFYRVTLSGHHTGTTSNVTAYTAPAATGNTYTNAGRASFTGTSRTFHLAGLMANHGPTALTYTKTQAHNLCVQSADLATTWTNSNTTESTNSVAAPDGTTTADTLVDAIANGVHRVTSGTITTVSGLVYTGSVYVKNGTKGFAALLIGDNGATTRFSAVVNLTTGVITDTETLGSPTSTSSSITAVGNDWYRVSVTMAAVSTSTEIQLCLSDSGTPTYANAVPTYNATDTTGTAYFWGAQVELASSPGKYVTTTTAAVYSANYDLPREWGAPNTVTNLAIWSQAFTNAAWTASSVTATDNTVANPVSGATTGATLALVDASSSHIHTSTAISFTLGSTYAFSVYAKANTHSYLQIIAPSGSFGTEVYANFDLSNGTVGTAGSSTTAAITDVGSGWYRCSVAGAATITASTSLSLCLPANASSARNPTYDPNSTNSIYVYGAQVELASTAGTYLHTTSTARTDYFYPTSLACQGLLVEEARTNICLYARDLTQSNYTKTSATAALTATGVDGVANKASTLTASAANGTAVQNITSASAARSLSMFVKRRTGTGTVTISHGATTGSQLISNGAFGTDTTGWTATENCVLSVSTGFLRATETGASNFMEATTSITTTVGKLYRVSVDLKTVSGGASNTQLWVGSSVSGAQNLNSSLGVTLGTYSYVFRASATTTYVELVTNLASQADGGEYTEWDNVSVLEVAETDITSSINSSTWTRVSITNETITNPCVAIKLATSGDAIDVDYCQSEAVASISSPIYTGSASVTRAADNPSFPTTVFPYTVTPGTLYAKLYMAGDAFSGTNALVSLHDTTNNERILLNNQPPGEAGVPATMTDGGASQLTLSNETFIATNKIALSYATNDVAVSTNGAAAQTDGAATIPTCTTLQLSGTATLRSTGLILQVLYVPRAMTDGELQTLSTP
jgi:hypothetical protein